MKLLIISALVLMTTSCSDFGNQSNNTPNDQSEACLNCAPPARDPNKPNDSNDPVRVRPTPTPVPAEPSPRSPVGDFSEEKMLLSLGEDAIYPMTKTLLSETTKLNESIKNFCSSADPTDAEFTTVQTQWANTMMAYHTLAAAPIGPMTDAANLLRDNIYAWPSFNPCGIDLEVVRLADQGTTNPALMFTMKGLAGLEYLLYDRSSKSSCNERNPKNQPAIAWRAKSASQKHVDRCKLATTLATDLETNVEKLEAAWNPTSGNFSRNLTNGSRYSSIKEAITAMSDALFAIEYVKDVKLGQPLGLHKDCKNVTEKCPDSVENKFSGLSITAAVRQLKGFRTLFTAGGVRGFDEYLQTVGHPKVAENILALVDQAIASGEALGAPGLLQQEIEQMSPGQCKMTTTTNRVVPVCAFFHDVRAIATKMKIEFLTVLSLRAPPTHGGDND